MNSSKSNFATIAAVAAVILVAVVGGVIYLLTRDPVRTANIRDIVIIVLVFITILFNLIIGGLVVALVYQVRGLVSTVTTEIKPILVNANQTVQLMRNTTTLVNDNVARPVIRMASLLAGLKRGSKVAQRKVFRVFEH